MGGEEGAGRAPGHGDAGESGGGGGGDIHVGITDVDGGGGAVRGDAEQAERLKNRVGGWLFAHAVALADRNGDQVAEVGGGERLDGGIKLIGDDGDRNAGVAQGGKQGRECRDRGACDPHSRRHSAT